MVSEQDKQYLFRSLSGNRCVLFVGAGFSADASNKFDQAIPDAERLSEILWNWLGLKGNYDGSPLGEVYQSALNSGRPLHSLRALLEDHLLSTKAQDWYKTVLRVLWMRIYGTNVDNVIEFVHGRSPSEYRLEILTAPRDDVRERDQFLRSVQYVKLNGSLPGDPAAITFATRQYAKRSAEYDRWYDHFVRDYVFQPTIFVGTELREPLFWQAIESRQKRGDNPEERPRSFLIAPAVSPAKEPILESLNIAHIRATGREFFEWLAREYDFPNRGTVLQTICPEAVELFTDPGLQAEYKDLLAAFLTVFPRVPLAQPVAHHNKMFFLGTPPVWADITNDFDAPREFTAPLLASIRAAFGDSNRLGLIGLLGAGGSGKSTVLHRLALILRQEGKQVFFSDGSERPVGDVVAKGLRELPEKSILFIDNAPLLGRTFLEITNSTKSIKRPPVIVFAARYNLYEKELSELAKTDLSITTFDVPDLSDTDIRHLIDTLDRHRQLGKLESMSQKARFDEFQKRAKKQILVAMREATQGRGFDDIIKSEFAQVGERESRVLFLCGALATAELLDLSSKQWLACALVPPAEALAILRRNLKGLLVEYGPQPRIAARHPIIAEYLVDRVASRTDVMEAYRRVLAALSHDTYSGPGRRGRNWRLIVRLTNHDRIYHRFTNNIAMARAIYESIAEWYRRDWHFWLQYTNLELEFGDLQLARVYLAHAESLNPDNDFVLTTKAHLRLREAALAGSRQEALELRSEAEEILLEQFERIGVEDEYPYHVYLTQMLSWIHYWEHETKERREALQLLYNKALEAVELHPRSSLIQAIHDDIKREYLNTATDSGKA